MGKIAILPEILSNQIAAGEVVERPAAVVKELIENAIDARSAKISVSLLQGGRKEIRVLDNGCGMSPEDALLAIERHATSKIHSADDLQAIQTLGFRGEALPSISSVSRFELVTREPDSLAGVAVKVEGGVIRDVRERGCPHGTQITVRDLFYNVPARRKFLRTAETESAYIADQFLRIAMAHPEIHFQLANGERLQNDFPKAAALAQRAGQVLGPEVARSLSHVDREKNGLGVTGFLSPPDIQRTNSQSLFLFVNGRPVWDRLLQRAVLGAYETLIPKGKYPVAVVFLELPPPQVDVNVHPSKREVRFRNPGQVIETVREALQETLSALRPKTFSFPRRDDFGVHSQAGMFREMQTGFEYRKSPDPTGVSGFRPAPFRQQYSPAAIPLPDSELQDVTPFPSPEPEGPGFSFASLPVIGQLANSYILLEAPDGLILIDQHAAHERVLFNQLASKSSPRASQMLAMPAVVDFLPKEAALLKRWLHDLSGLGFEMEQFGGGSFAVHAVPAVLSGCRPEELLRDFLKFAEEEGPASESSFLSALAKLTACHAAIKAGQRLMPEEIKHLLESLDATNVPFTCPHGRPLWFKLTHEQILRSFKRT